MRRREDWTTEYKTCIADCGSRIVVDRDGRQSLVRCASEGHWEPGWRVVDTTGGASVPGFRPFMG